MNRVAVVAVVALVGVSCASSGETTSVDATGSESVAEAEEVAETQPDNEQDVCAAAQPGMRVLEWSHGSSADLAAVIGHHWLTGSSDAAALDRTEQEAANYGVGTTTAAGFRIGEPLLICVVEGNYQPSVPAGVDADFSYAIVAVRANGEAQLSTITVDRPVLSSPADGLEIVASLTEAIYADVDRKADEVRRLEGEAPG